MSSRSTFQPIAIGIVATAVWFTIAVLLNTVSVATPCWVSSTNHQESYNSGLWRICTGNEVQWQCYDLLGDLSRPVINKDLGFIHAVRAFSIAAAAMSLLSVPLALTGFITRREIPVCMAAIVAFMQAASYAIALMLFIGKFTAVSKAQWPASRAAIKWSADIGGLCTVMYFIASLFFILSGILIYKMRRRSHAACAGVLSENAEGTGYRQLSDAPSSQLF